MVIFKLYLKLTTGWCRSNVCLVGKTVIVTGANAGIGYEAAEDFAKRGAKVILACRNESRGKDAEDRIRKATDNNNVYFKQLDLASLKSVRQFAKDINQSEDRLDILLNNGGAVHQGAEKTEDGFLITVATNYLGPFLLTNLLLDLLKKTPNSRVVNVSSMAGKNAIVNVNQLNHYPEGRLSNWKIYGITKAYNILFTIELAARLRDTSVTTYSLHPGVIKSQFFTNLSPIVEALSTRVLGFFMKSCIEGAQTSIYCSVQKGIESFTGGHFHDCQFVRRYKSVQDPDLPKKLWEVTEKLVGLDKQ